MAVGNIQGIHGIKRTGDAVDPVAVAVRIAGAVPEGGVWGVDIEPDMVRYLTRRAKKAGLKILISTKAGSPTAKAASGAAHSSVVSRLKAPRMVRATR